MKSVDHRWRPGDIIGGHAALELINTVSGWEADAEDWIPGTAGFLDWARTAGLLAAREARQAGRDAEASPAAAGRALVAVKELRRSLRQIIDALQRRAAVGRKELSVFNRWVRRLAHSEAVTIEGHKVVFGIKPGIPALELPGLRVTAAALSLIKEPPPGRIKTCPAGNCGWTFVDRSKNRSRRWCDMDVCGNLAKARQFRARRR